MPSRKTAAAAIFGIFIIISVAFFCFPQMRPIVRCFLKQWKKLQKVLHLVADFVGDKPEGWKQTIDGWFEVLDTLANLTASSTIDDETAKQRGRAKLRFAFFEENKFSAEGNATKAEEVINSIQFSSYEEKTLCNLKEGIPGVEFDATVDEIAEYIKMPEDLKTLVKRARNSTRGDSLTQNILQFKTNDGKMVFGRIAVQPIGDTIDMAYSLQSVTYKIKNKQSKPECARNLTKFSGTLNKANDVNDEDDDDDDSNVAFFVQLRNDFLAFYHKQAIKGFRKHCDYLIKMMDSEQKEEL